MNPKDYHMNVDNSEQLMRKAIALAKTGMRKNQGGPFGAIVVKDGKIVGKGNNQVTSTNDPTAHAEIEAIRDACKNLNTFVLSDCEIYATSEPCPMCLAAIYWARLKKMYYAATCEDAAKIGFDDTLIHDEMKQSLDQRILKSQQLLHDEGLKLFHEWENKKDKTPY